MGNFTEYATSFGWKVKLIKRVHYTLLQHCKLQDYHFKIILLSDLIWPNAIMSSQIWLEQKPKIIPTTTTQVIYSGQSVIMIIRL